jgi:hypothetical protein
MAKDPDWYVGNYEYQVGGGEGSLAQDYQHYSRPGR